MIKLNLNVSEQASIRAEALSFASLPVNCVEMYVDRACGVSNENGALFRFRNALATQSIGETGK